MYIKAETMTTVLYMSKEYEVAAELNQPEDIAWIAGKVNCLRMEPAEFKISDDDVHNASLVRFCNQEDGTVKSQNLFFFSGGRILMAEADVPYLYRMDAVECQEFFQKCDIYVEEVNRKNPGKCCGCGFYLKLPDELKA